MRKVRLKIIGRLIISINFLLLVGFPLVSQHRDTYEAVRHFQRIGEIDEALSFIRAPQIYGYRTLASDTTSYLTGKLYYQQKRISQSISQLTQVSDTSVFFLEAALFAGYQYAYINNYADAKTWLQKIHKLPAPREVEASKFLLSGISLLEGDLPSYELQVGRSDFSSYREIAPSAKRLDELHQAILQQKKKSAFTAGLLSTIVPGLGHMYVGNIGRGAMTLVTTGVFGLQAWESYRKDGINSVRFILFGSLFSGFYLANIYGSKIGVRLHQQQINDQLNESILVTMHVPLRYLFD